MTPGCDATSFTTTDSIGACLYGWTSNGSFRPTITSYTGTGGTVGVMGQALQDPRTGSAPAARFYPQNDYLLAAVAADNVGNIWMTNYGIPNAATPANASTES